DTWFLPLERHIVPLLVSMEYPGNISRPAASQIWSRQRQPYNMASPPQS
ncbi:MAG: hypothetical protein ACI9R8_001257, partial [Candidatus Paceibacteria bacterium]